MRTLALYEMLYGLVTLATGLVGFFAAGDSTLLIATLLSGILLIAVGLRTQKGWRPGLLIGLVISALMVGYFGYNFLGEEGGIIPHGLLFVMGILSIIFILLILVQPKERTRDF